MTGRRFPARRTVRRGAVLVALLICLLIVLLVSATVVRGLIVQHRSARTEIQQVQAAWLADSAIDRAAAKLDANRDYEGETWEVAIGETGDAAKGVAAIVVGAVDGEPDQRRISVEAHWPDDPVFRVMKKRQLTVDLVDSGEP